MSDVSVKLDELAVRTTSPDGRIGARLRDHRNVSIRFRTGDQAEYDDERTLAAQLGAVLNALWSMHGSAVRDLLTEAGGIPIASADHWDSRQRAYYTGLDNQVNFGMSAGRIVKVRSTGVTNFEFSIRPGTLAGLGKPDLLAEINGALAAWTIHKLQQSAALADEHLDLNLDQPVTTASQTPR